MKTIYINILVFIFLISQACNSNNQHGQTIHEDESVEANQHNEHDGSSTEKDLSGKNDGEILMYDIQPDIEYNEPVYLFTERIDSFHYIQLSYFSRDISLEAIPISEDFRFGLIDQKEFFTYSILPKETVSAIWFNRGRLPNDEFFAVTKDGDKFEIFYMGYMDNQKLVKKEINPYIIGKWYRKGEGQSTRVFNATTTIKNDLQTPVPYTVNKNKLIIHTNPDEFYDIIRVTVNELVLKDKSNSIIEFER